MVQAQRISVRLWHVSVSVDELAKDWLVPMASLTCLATGWLSAGTEKSIYLSSPYRLF